MKIKVIGIKRGGNTFYLNGNSCMDSDALVENPLHAINYMKPVASSFARFCVDDAYDPDATMQQAINGLYLNGDSYYGKSSVRADEAYAVEFEVQLTEVSRKIGRAPKCKT